MTTRLDVAFLVDTTGSMKDDIKAVKDSLFDIVDSVVSKTKNLQIRFALTQQNYLPCLRHRQKRMVILPMIHPEELPCIIFPVNSVKKLQWIQL